MKPRRKIERTRKPVVTTPTKTTSLIEPLEATGSDFEEADPTMAFIAAQAKLPQHVNSQTMLNLQRRVGNQAVQRLIKNRRTEVTATAVQRATGLPTEQEAITDGGKAGFKFIGKSAFGKILKALKDFEGISDTNKTAVAAKCVEIQGYIREWLNSGDRAKVKTGDEKKRIFLGKLRTSVKVRYFEAKLKAKTVDPAKQNAADSADTNREVIKEKLLRDELDASNKTINQMLGMLMAAKLTTNLAPDKVEMLTKAPDFQNIWMHSYADKSPGGKLGAVDTLGASNQREDAERYLGYDPFTEEQRENRPAYCGVNVFNNPKGAAPTYGRFFLVFDDKIKERATFTARDTFAMRKDPDLKNLPSTQTIASADNMEAILAFNGGVLRVLSAMVAGRKALEEDIRRAYIIYIEAQIHGGLSMYDVQEIVVQFAYDQRAHQDNLSDYNVLKAFCQKYNIPARFGGGGGTQMQAQNLV
jgi:Protein of unknown function (DUF3626)